MINQVKYSSTNPQSICISSVVKCDLLAVRLNKAGPSGRRGPGGHCTIGQFLLTEPQLLLSGLDRNRTCIWSFGNSYTIHCTTGPNGCKSSRLAGAKQIA